MLTRSPKGRVTRQKVLATHPDAGPFSDLSVVGRKSENGISVTSAYTFRDRAISAAWTIRRPMAKRAARAAVLFPSWGKVTRFDAKLRDGRTITAGNGLETARVRYFTVRGEYGAYRVTVPAHTPGTVRVFAARRQKANPRGGPTLGLQLPAFTEGTRHVSASIVPSAGGGLVGDPETASNAPYSVP